MFFFVLLLSFLVDMDFFESVLKNKYMCIKSLAFAMLVPSKLKLTLKHLMLKFVNQCIILLKAVANLKTHMSQC